MKHILSKPYQRRCKTGPTFFRFSKIQNGLGIAINSNLHSRAKLKSKKKKKREKKEKNRSRGHGRIFLALITNHFFYKNVNVDSREYKSP